MFSFSTSSQIMTVFLIRRLLNGLPVIAGVVLIVFFLFNILPADPARMMLGQRSDSSSIALINKDLGLNRPVYVQLFLYINDLSPISIHSSNPASGFYYDHQKYAPSFKAISTDRFICAVKFPYLRRSYQTKQEVTLMIKEKLPDTGILALASILIAIFAGIPLGILAALKKDKWTDRFIVGFSLIGISFPSFFASIIIAWLLGYVFSAYTGLNMTGGLFDIDPFTGIYINWKNLILPAIVLGLRPLAIIVQLTRSSMLEVLSQDFIRTARSKGLAPSVIVIKHALINSLNPVVTAISGWLGSLLAGAVFVEFIFGWNGIGRLTVTALENYDLPVVMGIVLFISIVFILLNILADFVNSMLDPRIRLT